MFVPPLEAPANKPTPIMVRRVRIAQAALDKFRDVPFEWGKADCAKLAAFVVKAAGYQPRLGRFGDYKSERGALRALKDQGCKTLADAVDEIKGLFRIPPIAALPGDLIAFPGDNPAWLGLTVCLGNGRALAFTEAAELGACSVISARLSVAVAAWNVTPRNG